MRTFAIVALCAIIGTLSLPSKAEETCANELKEDSSTSSVIDCLKRLQAAANAKPITAKDVKQSLLADPQAVAQLKGDKGDKGGRGEQGHDGRDASLPVGTVIAFADATGCPANLGWQPYKEAEGKFVLGAGEGVLIVSGPHSPGNAGDEVPLTKVRLGQQGGAEAHELMISEVAPHIHDVGRQTSHNAEFHTPIDRYLSDDLRPMVRKTERKGDAHNNMPPYIALYFCKKDNAGP